MLLNTGTQTLPSLVVYDIMKVEVYTVPEFQKGMSC